MVYIHSDAERKLPQNFDASCALYGAIENVQDVRLTSLDEVNSGRFDLLIKKHLFAGSVEFMQTVFSRAGVTVPSIHYLKQEYAQTVLADVRSKIASGETWFVKPLHAKLFTGMVFEPATISQLSSHADEVEVLIAEPFEGSLVSETRCYVYKGQIVDARNYAGDFRIAPNWNRADAIVASLQSAPVAFTMDIGVLENGRNVVVEYNDMWAIGNYGMENSMYYQLLADRYFEIMMGAK